MMEKNKKAPLGWAEPVLLVLWLALFVGSMTLFSACGPREDGSWMNCHRAQTALTVVGGAGLLLARLRCFCKRRVRRGRDLAALVLAILAILLAVYGILTGRNNYVLPLACLAVLMFLFAFFQVLHVKAELGEYAALVKIHIGVGGWLFLLFGLGACGVLFYEDYSQGNNFFDFSLK